jgi:GTPase Era involved in 16S rRNA processing
MVNNKIILVVGLTGSGKSTLCNSIINKSGVMQKLTSPFITSDGASGCTLEYQVMITNTLTIIDTVGFGDPKFQTSFILSKLGEALRSVGNKITHFVFVVKAGRISQELVNFLEIVLGKVLKNKCRNNSIMLFTDCEKNWVKKQKNPFLESALAQCNHVYYEYLLRFDRESDNGNDKARNLFERTVAVNALSEFLCSLELIEIDLSDARENILKHQFNQNKDMKRRIEELGRQNQLKIQRLNQDFNRKLAINQRKFLVTYNELKTESNRLTKKLSYYDTSSDSSTDWTTDSSTSESSSDWTTDSSSSDADYF